MTLATINPDTRNTADGATVVNDRFNNLVGSPLTTRRLRLWQDEQLLKQRFGASYDDRYDCRHCGRRGGH